MIYLYAVLGIAMISGTLAMFDVAFQIASTQEGLSSKNTSYESVSSDGLIREDFPDLKLIDRDLLMALGNGYSAEWNSKLCLDIKNFVASNRESYPFGRQILDYYHSESDQMGKCYLLGDVTSASLRLNSGRRLYHKIILSPSMVTFSPTRSIPSFFSCLIDERSSTSPQDVACSFED
jgi:hypothetical protein